MGVKFSLMSVLACIENRSADTSGLKNQKIWRDQFHMAGRQRQFLVGYLVPSRIFAE